jgi:DNA-binding MarR family transcriptional regulator
VSDAQSPAWNRSANLLGALSLVVADRTSDAVGDAAGRSETSAAALSALYHFLELPTVDLLRRVLGLTSSGTVRLLDRLEEAGFVKRGAGPDGRSTLVSLTPAGRRAGQRVTKARAEVLLSTLEVLTPAERTTLEDLVSRMLVGMMRGPGATRWMCRLCDTQTCNRAPGACPVTSAARQRYGT